MRAVTLVVLLALAGCSEAATGALAGVELASVPVFGRGVVDIGVSAVSGRDCSVVRLDAGKTYCTAREGTDQRPQPYCTRTIGTVTCWEDPGLMPASAPEVGDTPAPTPEQLRYRAARWPKSLNFGS